MLLNLGSGHRHFRNYLSIDNRPECKPCCGNKAVPFVCSDVFAFFQKTATGAVNGAKVFHLLSCFDDALQHKFLTCLYRVCEMGASLIVEEIVTDYLHEVRGGLWWQRLLIRSLEEWKNLLSDHGFEVLRVTQPKPEEPWRYVMEVRKCEFGQSSNSSSSAT